MFFIVIPFAFKSSEHGSYEDEMMEMEDVVDVEDYMGGEKYDSYNDAKEDIKDFKTTQRMKKIHRMGKKIINKILKVQLLFQKKLSKTLPQRKSI